MWLEEVKQIKILSNNNINNNKNNHDGALINNLCTVMPIMIRIITIHRFNIENKNPELFKKNFQFKCYTFIVHF